MWYWCETKNGGYAHRQYRNHGDGSEYGKQTLVLMHRQIIKAPKGQNVDHIDRNGLNNQRANLRLCTHAENLWNQKRKRAGYKGVTRKPGQEKWQCFITANDVVHYLGSYACPEAAAREYDKLAKLLHGEYALLNFPEQTK